MKIGVLALQGAFIEHEKMLEQIGVEAAQIRLPQHLDDLDGLIIPGGESTTIGKLATEFGLMFNGFYTENSPGLRQSFCPSFNR